ncbi:MAG: hypothetical protein IT174_11210 [Acidobacteria bacterium]|nr:hypothetical protein [Acidobacteriota bacterium]
MSKSLSQQGGFERGSSGTRADLDGSSLFDPLDPPDPRSNCTYSSRAARRKENSN